MSSEVHETSQEERSRGRRGSTLDEGVSPSTDIFAWEQAYTRRVRNAGPSSLKSSGEAAGSQLGGEKEKRRRQWSAV